LQRWRERCQWSEVQAAIDHHDLSTAASALDRYLEFYPNDASALFLAGRTARRLERYEKAEQYLKRCQEIEGVSDATRLEWDLFRIQQGELGEIHRRLRTSITPEHPDAPLVLEALARGYLARDRLMDAMEACDLWINIQADQPWAWLWRGGIYERLANFDQALADYQQALKIAPHDNDVQLSLGALLARGRRPGPAAEQFEQVLNRSPENLAALIGLAGCRLDQGEPADAMPLLERTLAADAENPRALVLLGKASLELGDPAAAEKSLNKAIEISRDDPEAFHQLVLALRSQNKDDQADRLAAQLEELHNDIDRLDKLIRQIAANPEEAALRHEAGMIGLRIGRSEDGVRWLLGALDCPGDHRATHAALAEHFAKVGDPRADFYRNLVEDR
jgi:Tfp pilus assembly protein PilF